MIQIRQDIFETNSSSTHAICIGNKYNVENLPKRVIAYLEEYGWGESVLNTPNELLSYLLSIIKSFYYNNEGEKEKAFTYIFNTLKKYNIDIIANRLDESPSYVDHADMGEMFIKQVLDNEDSLMNYLFSTQSFVATGNDNDDSIDSVNKMYKYAETMKMQTFYKGN